GVGAVRSCSCDVLTGTLRHPHPLGTATAVAFYLLDAVTDPGALLGLRVDQHHVADVNRGFDGLDATAAATAVGLADLGVAGDPLHAFDDEPVGVLENFQDPPLLPLVTATDDDDEVALLDLRHQITSGASETIRMNLLSRSSRATGPKIRVPRGSPSFLKITAAFSSKRM